MTIDVPRAYRVFQLTYLLAGLNFAIPVVSYVVDPGLAEASFDRMNQLLGGGPVVSGDAELWHMLAVSNVATLAALCFLVLSDLRRWQGAVAPLVLLKSLSAAYSLALAFTLGMPAFLAVFLLDAGTAAALLVTAEAALGATTGRERVPAWASLLLRRPRTIVANLAVAARALGLARTPGLWQLFVGTLFMRYRLLFRSDTIGTSRAPVRPTLRARYLRYRPVRLPFLLAEQAIAPFDLTGLSLEPERLLRHLVGAHHDGDQFAYDLELLKAYGALPEAIREIRRVVETDTPRTRWLRDLCVHEGYHEALLAAAERIAAGGPACDPGDARDPDITLSAFLAWCAAQPATPRETWAAWRAGRFSLRAPELAGA